MDEEEEPDDSASTLVRSGKSASTFTEMAAFVHDLEARPAPQLLADLPGLMALPEAKYGMVAMVIRRKVRLGGEEGASLLARLQELQAASDDPTVRERARVLREPPE